MVSPLERALAALIDDLHAEDRYLPVFDHDGTVLTSAPARALLDQYVIAPRPSTTAEDHAAQREALADLIPDPDVSERVADWPTDEQNFFRHGEWTDFTDRRTKLMRMRRLKAADIILDAGFTRTRNP